MGHMSIVLSEVAPTEAVGATMEVAKGITDFGMLAVTGAFFLVLTGLMWVTLFRWFKSIIDNVMRNHSEQVDELRKIAEVVGDVAEQLAPETLIRVKNYTGAHFDLSVEKVCGLIEKVRRENHIADREATRKKIRTLLQNMHDDRNTRFDAFVYRGRPLSAYANAEWLGWVAEIVEAEIYSPQVNHDRERTNVTAVYERIKIDFYVRMGKV